MTLTYLMKEKGIAGQKYITYREYHSAYSVPQAEALGISISPPTEHTVPIRSVSTSWDRICCFRINGKRIHPNDIKPYF